ncbi:sensor histidine kinase [Sphingomonas azotifigens]|uniref:sensor histidine kinase n=1 Tax=Sphingomonas azotifigens TaxID=330920 RepID=UPI0009FF3309|nr:HAMP domain-containing sensor histidine kinase [Sphingomonas azotifigens]
MLSSLRARLLLGAILWMAIGIGIAGISISAIFRQHVTEIENDELLSHLDELERLLVPTQAGGVAITRRLSDPRFEEPGKGFYWQVSTPRGPILRSSSLEGTRLSPPPRSAFAALVREVRPGPAGPAIIYARPWRASSPISVQIGIDQRLIDDDLAGFNRALLLSLGLLALALAASAILQVRFGLRPMRDLRRSLAEIRDGERRHLPTGFPSEVQPLVDDLNALLAANAEMLRRARTQAGNLAHGLKTPLAILADEARRLHDRGDAVGAAVLLQQSERMQRQIDFQLARARASANAGVPGVRMLVSPAIETIVMAMQRLHRARCLRIETDIDPSLRVGVDPVDLDEILANLIDNACKWAAGLITIRAMAGDDQHGPVRITIADDGPGIPQDAMDRVFAPGERLDEATPGSGLGLAIVRDLVALYGGSVVLKAATPTGLVAEIELVPA